MQILLYLNYLTYLLMAILKAILVLADIAYKNSSRSFHQGHNKFGETSGIQCGCNSLFAICWSSIKRVSVWKSWDLDYILENVLFKGINILRPLSVTEFPETVRIGDHVIKVVKSKQTITSN